MPPRDPFTYPTLGRGLPSMKAALEQNLKHPVLGVTQGGSSRKFAGAKVAATEAEVKQREE